MGALEQILIDLFFTPSGSILGITLFIILQTGLTLIRKEFAAISLIITYLLVDMYWGYIQIYPIFAWNIIVLMLANFFNLLYMTNKMRGR